MKPDFERLGLRLGRQRLLSQYSEVFFKHLAGLCTALRMGRPHRQLAEAKPMQPFADCALLQRNAEAGFDNIA